MPFIQPAQLTARKIEKVSLAGFGFDADAFLYIRSLGAGEFRTALDADGINQSAALLSASLCDADGQPVMTAEQVLEMPVALLSFLVPKALELNGSTEGAKKNSAET